MFKKMNRRDFIKISTAIGGISFLPFNLTGCSTRSQGYLYTPEAYDIFFKYKTVKKVFRFDTSFQTVGGITIPRKSFGYSGRLCPSFRD